MVTEISITIKPEDEKNLQLHKKIILSELKKRDFQNGAQKNLKSDDVFFEFLKKSVDARHGKVKFHLKYKVFIGEKPEKSAKKTPQWKFADGKKSVIIIGAGPAGLFGALKLLESGITPVILERGAETSRRKIDVAQISTKNIVNENSNYCFGEGGAGTFSDGKLYTRSSKRGDVSEILQTFVFFGADEKILTDAHPHIGTNKLPKIINNMREKIISLGGKFYFNTKATDFILTDNREKNGTENEAKFKITGVKTQNVLTGKEEIFSADAVLLATGHSANDIYALLAKIAPSALEAKTFAAGVRVEHPRKLIDEIQYRSNANERLGAAEYRLTTQVFERGVYTFCMCPGGFVVPSASGENEIVVNGMSAAERNSEWSNAAVVVEIRPQDIPAEFVLAAEKSGCPQIAGLLFRNHLERLAKQNGNGQAAPAQRLTDFLKNKKSESLPKSSYTPGLKSSNLCEWLPEHILTRLLQGFKNFNKNMKGFICDSAILIAVETRTSSPVRILRDKETFESPTIKSLFPCGEGSGYSGGIVSSAMDGINACVRIQKTLA